MIQLPEYNTATLADLLKPPRALSEVPGVADGRIIYASGRVFSGEVHHDVREDAASQTSVKILFQDYLFSLDWKERER
jgi:hypothetical protein